MFQIGYFETVKQLPNLWTLYHTLTYKFKVVIPSTQPIHSKEKKKKSLVWPVDLPLLCPQEHQDFHLFLLGLKNLILLLQARWGICSMKQQLRAYFSSHIIAAAADAQKSCTLGVSCCGYRHLFGIITPEARGSLSAYPVGLPSRHNFV